MEKTLVIHGRQPNIGRAELESLYGPEKLRRVGKKVSLVDVDPCLFAFDRLGGSVKFCKTLTTLDTVIWKDIEKFLTEVSPGHSKQMPEGKMHLGLSAIDLNVTSKQLSASGLTIKNAIKKTGRNVRVIPNRSLELNTAQVLHNNLIGPTGWELVLIRNGKSTVVAQTVKVQDIEAYTKRDRERPKRDAKVGMLPPKLAQIIINMAVGELPEESRQSVCDIPPEAPIPITHFGQAVLDPFCGTGVILQEAAMMGYDVYGSDVDSRIVEYTEKNLNWLVEQNKNLKTQSKNNRGYNITQADATSHLWKPQPDFIASEVYLGRPLSSLPDPQKLEEITRECDEVLKKFLKNIADQTKTGFRMCLAVPSWKTKNGFLHLKTLDKLSDLGYNHLKFVHISNDELIYHRPDQIVARELIVLERK